MQHLEQQRERTSAICIPSGLVNLPYSSNAFKLYKNSSALTNMELGGGVKKSKRRTLSIPSALSCSTKSEMSERQISGTVDLGRVVRADSGKRRKHLPAEVRPARPAR